MSSLQKADTRISPGIANRGRSHDRAVGCLCSFHGGPPLFKLFTGFSKSETIIMNSRSGHSGFSRGFPQGVTIKGHQKHRHHPRLITIDASGDHVLHLNRDFAQCSNRVFLYPLHHFVRDPRTLTRRAVFIRPQSGFYVSLFRLPRASGARRTGFLYTFFRLPRASGGGARRAEGVFS